MQNSIVPEIGHAVYQVLDDLGEHGHVWPEMAENEANEQTIIQWNSDIGQHLMLQKRSRFQTSIKMIIWAVTMPLPERETAGLLTLPKPS